MFGRKTAEKIDNAAAGLHRRYGKTGDVIANTVLAPVRRQIDTDCTRCAQGKCRTH